MMTVVTIMWKMYRECGNINLPVALCCSQVEGQFSWAHTHAFDKEIKGSRQGGGKGGEINVLFKTSPFTNMYYVYGLLSRQH